MQSQIFWLLSVVLSGPPGQEEEREQRLSNGKGTRSSLWQALMVSPLKIHYWLPEVPDQGQTP